MSLPTYLGLPLLDWQPDWTDPSRVMTLTTEKNLLGDIGPGPLKWDAPHQTRPRTSFRLRYILGSRTEMTEARDFLRSTAMGRLKSFWVPLWSQATHLTAPMLDSDTALTVTRSYFTTMYAGAGLGREHLAFFPRVATVEQTLIGRKIISATEGDLTETLTISSAVGYPVSVDDLVCFLLLCRMDTDVPVLQWDSFAAGILEVPVIDLPVQTP